MFAQIKQGKGKHAAQFVKQVFAPLFPAVNKNFGIGFGLEAVSGENQTLTQFAIVVKLSVEDHRDVMGFIPDGLMPARQINDAEAAHSEGEAGDAGVLDEEAFVIGAAVKHGLRHGSDAAFGIVTGGGGGGGPNNTHTAFYFPGWEENSGWGGVDAGQADTRHTTQKKSRARRAET